MPQFTVYQDSSKAGPVANDSEAVAGCTVLPNLTSVPKPVWERVDSIGLPARVLDAVTALRRACVTSAKIGKEHLTRSARTTDREIPHIQSAGCAFMQYEHAK